MTYQTLKAGDIRQKDDEQRRTDTVAKGSSGYEPRFREERANEFRWTRCWLAGHSILESDLMAYEYRRPLV